MRDTERERERERERLPPLTLRMTSLMSCML